jgi:hypothetical protein
MASVISHRNLTNDDRRAPGDRLRGVFEAATVGGFGRGGVHWLPARTLREWAEVCLARGEPRHREWVTELLGEAGSESEARGVPCCAAEVRERPKALEVEDTDA